MGAYKDWRKWYWSYVNKEGPIHPILKTKCWLWTGPVKKLGKYGSFGLRGRCQKETGERLAHRISYWIHAGNIPKDRIICHHCDVPVCVNPKHLYLGTEQSNAIDRESRGRRPLGYKYSDSDVLRVRKLLAYGLSTLEVSNLTGISKSHVWNIGYSSSYGCPTNRNEGILPRKMYGIGRSGRWVVRN